MKQINILDEIIVDNFAGGGGASTGIEMAIGRSVDIAINHDPAAIAMHRANHPNTEHYCENVWKVDPRKACRGRKVALAWFSPDCKHFSKAKGKKPRDKSIRGLAWVEVKWAAAVKPTVMMLENVEEFKTWGPLDDEGNPIEDRKGETFKAFVDCLTTGLKDEDHPAWPEIEKSLGEYFSKDMLVNGLGYQVEWKELRACDYGAPTIRKRFFLIARCDGQPIRWPVPTHGDPKSKEVKSGKLLPWKTASEIIDWSITCPSIFDRNKPLAENTLKRIARGLQKFVIDSNEPFIVSIGQTGFSKDRSRSIHQPLNTIVTKQEQCLITPTLIQYHTETSEQPRGQTLDKPIATLDTSPRYGLVSAFISKYYGGFYEGAGSDIVDPVGTITTKERHAVVTAYVSQQYKSSIGHQVDKPLGTITVVNKASLVTAFLLKYYGADIGQNIETPLHTVTSKDRFGLVTIEGQDYQIVDIGMRMLQPHELFAAQGFPENYIIDHDDKGNPYPKTAQVARCGNAVPPPFAEALTRANLPELCDSEDTGRYSKVV